MFVGDLNTPVILSNAKDLRGPQAQLKPIRTKETPSRRFVTPACDTTPLLHRELADASLAQMG